MGLEILTRAMQAALVEGALVADRALCLMADEKTVVEERDPRAAFVLCGQGGTIPADTVKRLQLVMIDGQVVQKGGVEPEEPAPSPIVDGFFVPPTPPPKVVEKGKTPAEDKSRSPSEDKSRTPGENKTGGKK